LRLHETLKPITLLDHDGFWSSLFTFLDTTVAAGFVKENTRRMLQRASSPTEALDQLRTYSF
jgi:predicted Rossmann-fold nucleotide-binding protein